MKELLPPELPAYSLSFDYAVSNTFQDFFMLKILIAMTKWNV